MYTPELFLWLSKLWENPLSRHHYRRLASIDLAEIRVECGTIGELIERYVPCVIDGVDPKERTMTNRRTACNSFLFFLANQRMGNFRRNARLLDIASMTRAKEETPKVAEKYYAMIRKTYQPSTWGRRIKHVKTMFGQAVELGWITKNPFEKCRGTAQANKSPSYFVKPEEAQQVLDACPNTRLKLVFSFARWGGLRIPSEIAFMRWSDILWKEDKISIPTPKKTKKFEQENGNFKTRFIPIFPEIRVALEAYRAELLKNGEFTGETGLIFPGMEDTLKAGALLRKQFGEILKRAGIEACPKFFVNLRSTRDTELQDIYPIRLVCEWLGHSPETSLKHYTQVTADDYHRASRGEKG